MRLWWRRPKRALLLLLDPLKIICLSFVPGRQSSSDGRATNQLNRSTLRRLIFSTVVAEAGRGGSDRDLERRVGDLAEINRVTNNGACSPYSMNSKSFSLPSSSLARRSRHTHRVSRRADMHSVAGFICVWEENRSRLAKNVKVQICLVFFPSFVSTPLCCSSLATAC